MTIDVDKLIFTLDGDLTPLRAKYAQAETDAAAAGKRIQASLSVGPTGAGAQQVSAVTAALGSYSGSARDGTGATNELAAATDKLTGSHQNLHQELRESDKLIAALAQGSMVRSTGAFALLAQSIAGLGPAGIAGVVGIAALTGAFVAAQLRLEELTRQANTFQTIITGMGSHFGGTGADVLGFTKQVASTGPFSEDQVNKAAEGLLRLRGVGADTFKTLLPLAEDYAKVTGQELPAAAAELGAAATGSYEAIKKINDALGGMLSPDTLNRIRLLQQSGAPTAAFNLALPQIQQQIGGLAQGGQTGTETSMKSLGNAWRDMLDAASNPSAVAALTGILNLLAYTMRGFNSAPGGPLQELQKQTAPESRSPNSLFADPTFGPLGSGTMPTVPLRNAPAGVANMSPADLAAFQQKFAQFSESMEIEQRTLNATEAALKATITSHGDLAAAEMRAKLSSDPFLASLSAEEKASIGVAVATRQRIDLLTEYLAVQQRIDAMGHENAALGGVATASAQGPAAEAQARAQAQAIAMTSKEMDSAVAQGNDRAVESIIEQRQRLAELIEEQDKFNSVIDTNHEVRNLQQANQLLQLKLSLMGSTAEARAQEIAALETEFELENAGLQKGTEAYQQQYNALSKVKSLNAQLTTELKQQTDAQQKLQEAGKEVGNVFADAFEKMATNTKDWRKTLADIPAELEKIALKLLVIQPLEAAIFGSKSTGGGAIGGGGGIGGLFGSLLGSLFGPSLGSPGSAASAGTTGVPGLFAGGGPTSSGPIIVGEGGPELWTPPADGGSITTSPETRRMMGGGSAINFTQQVNINPDVSQIAQQQILRMLPTIRAHAIAGVTAAAKRNNIQLS